MKEKHMFQFINQLVVSQYLSSLKNTDINRITLQMPDFAGEDRVFLLVHDLSKWSKFVNLELKN
jgi:hypothetical protein